MFFEHCLFLYVIVVSHISELLKTTVIATNILRIIKIHGNFRVQNGK